MRESRLGMIVSIALHSCVIPLVVAASFALDNRPGKVVEIDFKLIKDRAAERSAPEIGKQAVIRSPQVRKGGAEPGRTKEHAGPPRENMTALQAKEQAGRPAAPTRVTASDPQGDTLVHGVEAASVGSSEATGSLHTHGGAAGGSGHGDGGATGGPGSGSGLAEGGRDYNYIRDAVVKNIKYPDQAIRLGMEGRVLISFIVLENGTTSNIKVVNGSGCRLLDESAREAVAITRIHKKVPYRVVVHLPVTYKLQG